MSNAVTMAIAALLLGMSALVIECANARLDELDGASELEPAE